MTDKAPMLGTVLGLVYLGLFFLLYYGSKFIYQKVKLKLNGF